jgi:hypothetical protein
VSARNNIKAHEFMGFFVFNVFITIKITIN